MGRRAVGFTDVIAALAPADPAVRWAVPIRRLEHGHGSAAWLVRRPDGALACVKAALRGATVRTVVAALATARQAGVVTPAVLAVAEEVPALGVEAAAFELSWIEGEDLTQAAPALSPADLEHVGYDLGTNLARLHAAAVRGFANDPAADSPSFGTWPALAGDRLRRVAERYQRVGVEFPSVVAAALPVLEDRVDGLAAVAIRPGLTHRDVYSDNVIVNGGRLAALIDFEQAKLWDPVNDFAKVELLLRVELPDVARGLFDGYQDASPGGCLPPAFELRLAVAIGLELVWGVPYFLRWGQRDMADRWLERLSAFVSEG